MNRRKQERTVWGTNFHTVLLREPEGKRKLH
jgi:hypothetical protein